MPMPRTIVRTLSLAAALMLALPVIQPMAAQPMAAQQAPLMTDLMQDLAGVEKKFIDLAKATPDDKLSWRPGAGVRSMGEVLLHVASDNYFIPSAFGHAIPSSTGIKADDYKTLMTYEKRTLSKAQVVAELEQSFAYMKGIMGKTTAASLTQPVSLFGMKSTGQGMWILAMTHLHEHLGQSIAYARMNGIVPPWSK
jgi:uncharacterized damage-inducible protein DinB